MSCIAETLEPRKQSLQTWVVPGRCCGWLLSRFKSAIIAGTQAKLPCTATCHPALQIESDLQHLSRLLVAVQGKRRATGMRLTATGGPGLPVSSDECSPSSQQGEDENESGNPTDQQLHAAMAAQWASHKTVGSAGMPVMQQHHHQQQAGMV